jgi:hypothetical protein
VTTTEVVTAVGVFAALLWNVVNEIRLREHSKALQANEAHLRVTSELRLRLHQQSWDLLRQIQDAAFSAFEAIRNYQVSSVSAARGVVDAAQSSRDYDTALVAVQRIAGLAHVAPPDKKGVREASSGFTKAFNMINGAVLTTPRPSPEEEVKALMPVLNAALKAASVTTATWNEELWQHQNVADLARR